MAGTRKPNNCGNATLAIRGKKRRHLPASENRPEVGFGKDASDFLAFVSLDFDLAIFYRAARSTSLLHRFGQALLLRQTDPDKALHHCNRLAAAPSLLSDDVHSSSALSRFVASFWVGCHCLRAR